MINRRTLIGLAAATAVLFVVTNAIGDEEERNGEPFFWIMDDVLFFAFVGCALTLIVLSVGVLVRWATRSRNVKGA